MTGSVHDIDFITIPVLRASAEIQNKTRLCHGENIPVKEKQKYHGLYLHDKLLT